ncbi:MAG: hypothetical protein BVN34_08655 [Proteobacteria bacterium ST_bin12]|nr:MAG: hypothetical protein BVN34_08655 [Proteobacteria bacterium ST_bin12]
MNNNQYNLKPKPVQGEFDRTNLTISSKSKYEDSSWDFSEFESSPNVKPTASILRFDFDLNNGLSFSDEIYKPLKNSFKEIIYSMASSPKGKLPSPATLKKKYSCFRFFFNFIIDNNYSSLKQLSRADTDQYILLVKDQDVHPVTKINQIDVLSNLWKYRKNYSEPISFDALNGQSSQTVASVTRQDKAENKYDFIPDEVCQNLIRSCVKLIREKGIDVALAVQTRDQASLNELIKGKSRANKNRAKKKSLIGLEINNSEVTTLARQMLTCCYVIINFFTGIRASEMLSLGPNTIVVEDGHTWILGSQFKIQKKKRRWMAPEVVHEAFHLAKSLTQSMRDSIDYEIVKTIDEAIIKELRDLKNELFLNWSQKRKHGYIFQSAPQVSNIKSSIHTSLKELVVLFGIKDESGDYWNLHSHQFRRSFVRFMCANAMNIRYLQEHMGHKSLDMTAWYDSDDLELTEEISKQMKEFKTQKLDAIFNGSQKITGAGSENLINERKDYYVGITVTKSKNKFLEDLADDVSLRSTGHSWCMGDSSVGSCTGVVGCMMDVSMTQKCTSALITEEHLPAWEKIKIKNVQLLNSSELGLHQKEALKRVIAETIDPTINALRSSQALS